MNLSKIRLRLILLIFIFSGFVFFLIFILKNTLENRLRIENQKIVDLQGEIKVKPIRLKIPSLDVDSFIESVGLTKEGRVDSPKSPENAAWFNESPLPGEVGNSIIDGHSGWKNGIPAVFDNLYKLKIGDKIYVENENGEVVTFVVTHLKKYKSNENAPDVFISNDGMAHLNLITCTGFWNKILKSRSERLVVFTDKEI